jgi:hypothetical protein
VAVVAVEVVGDRLIPEHMRAPRVDLVAVVAALDTLKDRDLLQEQMEQPTQVAAVVAVLLAMVEPLTEVINAPMVEVVALELSLFGTR